MEDIALFNHFLYKGELNYENESFQNLVIKDIDFKLKNKATKFYRCDFRGTKISNVTFFKNNFDRSDFVDSYIADSTVEDCYFGTDFFNTYFNNVHFSLNFQDGCSLINCTFFDCDFVKEKFAGSTIKNCKFINCSFTECIFSMNTIDEIEFETCQLQSIDFSNTTAQNFTFSNCNYNNLTINPDYLGTYLFKNTNIDKIAYSYKGDNLLIGKHYLSTLEKLISYYIKVERFYEFFNLVVIYNYLSKNQKPIGDLMKVVINKVIIDPLQLRRENNLNKIIQSLMFYSDSNAIKFHDYILLVNHLETVNTEQFNFKFKIELVSKIQSLKIMIEDKTLSWDSIIELPTHSVGLANIVLDASNKKDVIRLLDEYFKLVSSSYFKCKTASSYYKIIDIREGSIIVDVLSYAGAFMILATCVRGVFSNILNTFFDYKIYSKSKELLANSESLNEIKKIDVFRKTSLNIPSDELVKKANDLGKMMKSFKILVHTFKE